DEHRAMAALLEEAGRLSARAQALPAPITSLERLHADQRLYIASHDASDPSRGPSVVLGFLKVGEKRLFVSDPRGNTVEIEPCCVLDFYVHESCQRGGIGSELFARFLEEEDHRPARLAYDRPSHKLKSFLRKHFGLVSFSPNANNYVVFRDYWDAPRRP
ncbi:uncharacterized protein MICPUCDRAFT_6581, partial [Micromonas pusilla CCMP1545]